MPLLTFLLLILSLWSCGSRGDLTVAVGGSPDEVEYWRKLVEDFERREGIKARIIRQPTDTDLRRQTLVVALVARKSDPDVFLMDVAWVSQFVESGWLEEIRGVDPSPFFRSAVTVGTKAGKVYTLPLYVDCGVLYYRKDLLEKYGCPVPKTWGDLVKCSLRVKEGGKDPYEFLWQGAQYEGLICTFLEFAVSAGGDLKDLDSPQNVRALTFMRDLIHTYRLSPPNTYTEMKEEEVRILFQNGGALFERNWPYAWALHNSEDSPVKGRVGVTLIPKFRGGRHASCLGGWHVGISRFSDRKEQALKFVKFVTSREVQIKLALDLGWNPGRKDVYKDLTTRSPHLEVVRRSCEVAVPRPRVPYYTRISEVLRRYLNSALAGSMDPQEALRKAKIEIGKIEDLYR